MKTKEKIARSGDAKKAKRDIIIGAETSISRRDAVDLAEYNPRTQTTESADRLSKSLAAFGLADLPVVNLRSAAKGWPKDSRPCLVGGHQRLQILDAKHGTAYSFRHTIVDLDAPMEKALNVALNNPMLAGEYDIGKLAPIMISLKETPEFDVEMTGFTMPKIDDICIDAGLMEMPKAGGGADGRVDRDAGVRQYREGHQNALCAFRDGEGYSGICEVARPGCRRENEIYLVSREEAAGPEIEGL